MRVRATVLEREVGGRERPAPKFLNSPNFSHRFTPQRGWLPGSRNAGQLPRVMRAHNTTAGFFFPFQRGGDANLVQGGDFLEDVLHLVLWVHAEAEDVAAGARRGLDHKRGSELGVADADGLHHEDVRFCRYRFPATDVNSKATWFGIQ
jgi:hypothetical protein